MTFSACMFKVIKVIIHFDVCDCNIVHVQIFNTRFCRGRYPLRLTTIMTIPVQITAVWWYSMNSCLTN